jgi:hypothetical protein
MTPMGQLLEWINTEQDNGRTVDVTRVKQKIRGILKSSEKTEFHIFYNLGKVYGARVPFREIYDEHFNKIEEKMIG